MNPVVLSSGNFEEEVLKSELPVLVDFWAPWCAPCHIVGPVVESLARELAGSLKVGKLNVDDNQALAMQYGVMSIPTLMIFKGGKPAQTVVGAVPRNVLEEALKPHLG